MNTCCHWLSRFWSLWVRAILGMRVWWDYQEYQQSGWMCLVPLYDEMTETIIWDRIWHKATLKDCKKISTVCQPLNSYYYSFFYNCLHMFSKLLTQFTKLHTQNASHYKLAAKWDTAIQNSIMPFQNPIFVWNVNTTIHNVCLFQSLSTR